MKVWVTAGGTGSAFHISTVIKEYFADKIELYISDINEPELVAAATLADHFYKVPLATSEGYAEYMYGLLKDNGIDLIIPLIPWEQKFFSDDNDEFAKLGIKTAAPNIKLSDALNNKVGVYEFCKEHNIPTIEIFDKEAIEANQTYFIKPIDGFGAMGAKKITGAELINSYTDEELNRIVIQEYCDGPEITVEAFLKDNSLHTIARERIESKCGVCTKARILNIPEVDGFIKIFTEHFDFPQVFNIQFIQKDKQWKVMDINLRLAAGTGLSNAAGFQLIRAYMLSLLNEEVRDDLFDVDYKIVSILRVYKEVVVK